ncbi:MAG: hypothetical protein ACK5V3_18430 [Bdellovibrionales bacterium]
MKNPAIFLIISMALTSPMAMASSKCSRSVKVQTVEYPRITLKNKSVSYEGMTSSMGLFGEVRNIYFENLIKDFDLFNIQGTVKLKFPNEGLATVQVIEEFGARGLLFKIGKEKREVRVLEKSLIETLNDRTKTLLSAQANTYYKSQRYEGRDVAQALELLALHISGNAKKVSELKSQYLKAFEQLEIDYLSFKGLAEVVPNLVAVMRDKKSKIDEPSSATQNTLLKEIGKVDFIRSWMIGDFDHVLTYYTQGKNSYLRIWTSTGEGIGLITTIHLNSFNVKKPQFDFNSALGTSSLVVDSKSGKYTWSEGRNPNGEELRLVFTLELLKLKIEEL